MNMTRTILRIKRRRTEEPLPFIRLEGLHHAHGASGFPDPRHNNNNNNRCDDANNKRGRGISNSNSNIGHLADLDSANLSDFLASEQERPNSNRGSSVLWKRLEPLQGESESCRVVDALLEGNHDGRQSKRRKLTLLESNSGPLQAFSNNKAASLALKRKTALKVLNPVTRMVDDSLQEAHAGTRSVAEHYRFVTTDPLLAMSDIKKWLQWTHSSGGNLLHACALWNDVEVAGELLQISNLAGPLCEALDGDGRTPYEVAQLSGHDSVCEVLEAFGGDTTNYVFDIFCLDDEDDESALDGDAAPTSVELTSGVAYWTPEGELMLEASDKMRAAIHDDDDDSDEMDSNCENFDANDYPDEDDHDAAWGYQDYEATNLDPHHDHFSGEEPPDQESCALDRNQFHRTAVDMYRGEEDNNDLVGGY